MSASLDTTARFPHEAIAGRSIEFTHTLEHFLALNAIDIAFARP